VRLVADCGAETNPSIGAVVRAAVPSVSNSEGERLNAATGWTDGDGANLRALRVSGQGEAVMQGTAASSGDSTPCDCCAVTVANIIPDGEDAGRVCGAVLGVAISLSCETWRN
jgi:hypothetical protein